MPSLARWSYLKLYQQHFILLATLPYSTFQNQLALLGSHICHLGGFIRFQVSLQNDCHLFYRNNLNSLNLKYQSSIISDLAIKPMWQCQKLKDFFWEKNITTSCLVVLGKPTLSKLYSHIKQKNPRNFQLRKSKKCRRNACCPYDPKTMSRKMKNASQLIVCRDVYMHAWIIWALSIFQFMYTKEILM